MTTALNTLNRMVHSPEGHQMVEISTPVLISSTSPSMLTQHGDRADFPASSAGQVGNESVGTGVLGKKASPCPKHCWMLSTWQALRMHEYYLGSCVLSSKCLWSRFIVKHLASCV